MQEVFERTAAPYNAVCYIEATFPNGPTLRGSGVLVGPNDVLTAMHMVFQAAYGGWATSVRVIPAADIAPFDAPFGAFTDSNPTLVGRAANWDPNGDGLLTDDEAQFDIAVIGLHSRVGEAAGWMSTAQQPADFAGPFAGYPISGTGMMGEPVFAEASADYGVYDSHSTMGPGASGGPLFYTSGGEFFVAGVLSSGNSLGEVTYAALFGAGTQAWLAGVTAANDDLIGGHPQSAITGTPAADLLPGDALDNTMAAGAGDDFITGASGNDTLDGEAGADTAAYAGLRSSYLVDRTAMGLLVTDGQAMRDGTDQLVSVERLHFSDGSFAFDFDGSAAVAARIIGAVFGAGAVSARPDYAGIGLWHLDHGINIEQLVQLALDARLGEQADDAAVIQLLYTNVVGHAPAAGTAAYYAGLLESGAFSQAGLAMFAVQSDANAASIGLTGLADSGLAYEPLA
ncbi:MAG TPA: hypothetical protein VK981_00830 [Ramlibacter sp.]|nr:hypothetical protein [Ramlibacter sp.]